MDSGLWKGLNAPMKKILTTILIFGTVASLTISYAAAFGGTYPQSTGYVPFNEPALTSEKEGYTPTESKHLFTVGGKTFILLDTDSVGNYFVMTEEHYGRHAFETAIDAHLLLEEAVAVGNGYTFVKRNEFDNQAWIFNPKNNSSIAYWLNHDFYEQGNGGNYRLPMDITDYILERDWQVEGFKTYSGSGKRLYDNYFTKLRITGFTPSETLAAAIYLEPYSVRCKIALMSYSEYMAYQNIIGVSFVHSTWGGMMLRSQDAFLTTGNENNHTQLRCYFGPMQVLADSPGTPKRMRLNLSDAPNAAASYFVRPVFWLSKDFFKRVKCDVQSLGTYPMRYIRENSYSELYGLYTREELSQLGMEWSEGEVANVRPYVSEVGFYGDAAAGKAVRGSYIYHKNSEAEDAGLSEFDTRYQWFISNTANGEKIPIANADELVYTPTDQQTGQYLWFSVTPRNAFTNNGETVFSKNAVKIRARNHISVYFLDTNGNTVITRPEDGTVLLHIDAPDQQALVYIIKYDEDRRLVGMETVTLSNQSLENYRVELPAGVSCKVMILDNINGLKPYGVYEIK